MSDYSFSLTTFSPSGKLGQLDNAMAAVASGHCSIGIRAVDGVVVASERKIGTLLIEPESIKNVAQISESNGISFSGTWCDFDVLVKSGRKAAAEYKFRYGEEIPVNQLAQKLAKTMQEFTQKGGVRPFGIALFVAGFDDSGPQLFQVDPSGAYWPWKASALGQNEAVAVNFLEKRYSPSMELTDAIVTALSALKDVHDGSLTNDNVHVAIVDESRKFHILSPSEVQEYLLELD
eukprot:TRINITY_DN2418_c0_g1_i1.p1 TRINITY_DN2418_c0_g1~~TRINITY_DN2418_c0_g1_i1.p1  ORF type:complete len:234 (+),score=78.61 TRINITY_DN2418_c0_g1_i1:165-866(+)